jgi:hypothetical protein
MPVSSRPGVRPSARPYPAAMHSTGVGDPFATNPIRRSLAVVVVTSATLAAGPVIGEDATRLVMVTVGWLAIAAWVLSFPVLVWSLAEEVARRVRRRVSPPVAQLGLSPRVEHILTRHGYDSVRQVEEAPDETLAGLSNMDARALREVRRAVSLWRYRRWQEAGFPAGETP